MMMLADLLLAVGDLESDLSRNPGGNLAIWLSFIGAMFAASVTVIVAALNRGRKELHSDHADVQILLAKIESNQEDAAEDRKEMKASLSAVHKRLDVHLEHHNDRQDGFRRSDRSSHLGVVE